MKRNIFNLIIAFLMVAFIAGCGNKQKGSHAKIVKVNGNEVVDCNISEVTDTIDLPLSEIISECEIIPLETNEKSLFESVYHVSISENYIAIHSRGSFPIKLFTREGKFIRDIGKIGRGPGEFNSLYGIQLDEDAKRIYLTPFARATKLFVYSLDGENLPDIPLVYPQTKFHAYVTNNTVTVLSMPFEGEPIPIACQQTIEGKLLKECFEPENLITNPRNAQGQFVGFNSELSSSRNADAFDYFKLSYGSDSPDTLYHYDVEKNRMIPQFVAFFTGEKQGTWIYEWKSHYCTQIFGKKYNGAKVLVDKKTLKSDFFRIKNDFWGGYEINKFYMSNNGMFISSINAMQLMEELDKSLKKGELKSKEKQKIETLLSQLKEDDNEVLFVGKMK
ncbi:6-bladed beta-propeller [Maribellus maritimus]|uniref:6-bladed beta-propeller n=1 Tax=Maribellus maritimus TaxID=2870838 RepID=UPI001EEA3D7C|nr:6-bladed beta-propeller [Maribellus maritimus]MCG6189344.1 6-bladed beta-propeller [Maribellus maritimus]